MLSVSSVFVVKKTQQPGVIKVEHKAGLGLM